MKAIFQSIRGEGSALCLVRANEFEFTGTPVYLPRQAVLKACNLSETDVVVGEKYSHEFELPDGGTFVPFNDRDGNQRTASNGSGLLTMKW